jgi:choline dehydrogenase-like flavoprotein
MFAVVFEGDSLRDAPRGRGYSVALRTSSGIDGGAENDILIHPTFNRSSTSRTVALFVFLYHCHSRGLLRLTSPDAEVPPQIDERLLTDANDRARMRAAVRSAVALAAQKELRAVSTRATLGRSNKGVDQIHDNAALDARLLLDATDAKHISGTCPMGRNGGEGVVVDPEGKVFGVSGLRIADLSITPRAPRANTYLTAVMIGEHIAAMICSGSETCPA